MGGEEVAVEIEEVAPAGGGKNGMPFQEEAVEDAPARVTYIDYLKSPVIGLLVTQAMSRCF